MKIKSVKAWSTDLGNTKPYTIAFKTIDEVRNAFVEITLDNGLTGIGAANPDKLLAYLLIGRLELQDMTDKLSKIDPLSLCLEHRRPRLSCPSEWCLNTLSQ